MLGTLKQAFFFVGFQVRQDSKKSKRLESHDSTLYEDTADPEPHIMPTYDEVYEHSHSVTHHPLRYKSNPQNPYENIKAMNLVGSLKKKLKAGRIKNINYDDGANNNHQDKCNNGKDHKPLQNKPVPAARSSMKKDSKNKVQMVKPARQPKPKRAEPAKLKNRPSSEAEFVENDLYADRDIPSPYP